MASPQKQQFDLSAEEDVQREGSIESDNAGEINANDAASSSASTTGASTPNTELATSPKSSKKRKLEETDVEHSDSEYETFRILKGHPKLRDPTELPIVTETADGVRKVLWAKMDTGADANIIAEKIVQRLGLTSDIVPVRSADDGFEIHEIGGNQVEMNRKITLSFRAGRKNVHCQDVEFWIPSQKMDSDKDGIPDVLLGLEVLRKYHMVMIDPDFCNEPEAGLEVLAKPAAEECPDRPTKAICLGVKFNQVKGPSVRR